MFRRIEHKRKNIVFFAGYYMGKSRKFLFSLILLLVGANCFAGQISIQIVQHDKVNKDVSENSLIIEDEVMTGFFNNGFIVTNSPAVVSESQVQDDSFCKAGIGEAYDGCSDYFVQIKLFYKENVVDLQKIDLSIFSVTTGKKIKDSTISSFSLNKKNTTDLYKTSSDVVAKIKEAIKA